MSQLCLPIILLGSTRLTALSYLKDLFSSVWTVALFSQSKSSKYKMIRLENILLIIFMIISNFLTYILLKYYSSILPTKMNILTYLNRILIISMDSCVVLQVGLDFRENNSLFRSVQLEKMLSIVFSLLHPQEKVLNWLVVLKGGSQFFSLSQAYISYCSA